MSIALTFPVALVVFTVRACPKYRHDSSAISNRHLEPVSVAFDVEDHHAVREEAERAGQFYINGEVRTTGVLKLDPGMTVLQAIAKAGGVTERGSARRVSIKRRNAQGSYTVISAKSEEKIQPDDVITVKERLF